MPPAEMLGSAALMPVGLSDAVDDLIGRQTQDSGRLDLLAKYCIEAFERVGLPGVRGGKAAEVGIRGLGRQKDWDQEPVRRMSDRWLEGGLTGRGISGQPSTETDWLRLPMRRNPEHRVAGRRGFLSGGSCLGP